jgi:four helix bundle protein
MRDFRKYLVWKKGHEFALEVYQQTNSFPKAELFALTSQIRRAASSIPINIAEGCGRNSDSEFSHFLNIAAGSTSEVDEELLLAYDLGYLEEITYLRLNDSVNEIKAMLNKLISTLKKS